MSKQTMFDIFEDEIKDIDEASVEDKFDLELNNDELNQTESTLNMVDNVTGDLEEVSIDEQFDTLNLDNSVSNTQEVVNNVNNTQSVEVSSFSPSITQEMENTVIVENNGFNTQDTAFDISYISNDEINTADLEEIANQSFEQPSDVMLDGNFTTIETTKFTQEVGEVTLVEDTTMDEIEVKIDSEDLVVTPPSDFGNLRIAVIGIGGCGCNTINRMYKDITDDIKLISIDTDERRLENCDANEKILVGTELLHGNGSGNDVMKVRESFMHAERQIREQLDGVHMVCVTGSLAGGTGKVGMVEVGRLAKSLGILTLAFVVAPNRFEANEEDVNNYYNEIDNTVDSTILIESDREFSFGLTASPEEVQGQIDRLLVNGIRGIYELATEGGKVNLDFADIRTAFKDQGPAVMSVGWGEGENNIVDAVSDALDSNFLNKDALASSKTILFAISIAHQSVTIKAMQEATDIIYKCVKQEEFENLFFGMSYDDSLGDKVKVTVVVCGMERNEITYDIEDEDDFLSDILSDLQPITDSKPNSGTKESKKDIFDDMAISGFDSDIVISTEEKTSEDYPDFS